MDDMVSVLALRESEELHRITLLSMSDAVFITNDEEKLYVHLSECRRHFRLRTR